MRTRSIVAALLALASVSATAQAESDAPLLRPAHKPREIVINVPGERSTTNRLTLLSLLGAGVIGGAVGLYFHLDSRDSAEALDSRRFSGDVWTPDRAALVEDNDRARQRATIGYAIGSVFAIATIVTFIVTEPPSQRTVIRTGASASLVPGGAIATHGWEF